MNLKYPELCFYSKMIKCKDWSWLKLTLQIQMFWKQVLKEQTVFEYKWNVKGTWKSCF